jgi:YgiT-type zinc finger domain-containing protein
MKRKAKGHTTVVDRDTMRPEYDFSRGVRGVTAARFAKGANVVVIDPEVLDVFPDGPSVNEVLKALAPVIRRGRRGVRRRRSAWIWNEARVVAARLADQEAQVMRCGVCGAEMTATKTGLPFKVRDAGIVILTGLPVLQCGNCPEY